MKTGIKKIIIEIKGKEFALTVSEARALFNELNELYGPKYTYNYSYPITTTTAPYDSSIPCSHTSNDIKVYATS